MAEITQAGIDALKEQLDEVEDYLRLDEQRQVVAQLEATSTAPGFWDDAEAASGVMAELTQAKDEVRRVDAARQRIGDIQAAFDLGQETGEEELLDEADGLAAARIGARTEPYTRPATLEEAYLAMAEGLKR